MAHGPASHIVVVVAVENRSTSTNNTVTPSTLATPITFPTPTVISSPTVTPSVLATPITFQAPAATGGVVISPSVLATPIAFQAPTVISSPTVSPAVLATPITFRTATVFGGVTISPATLATPITFRAPTVISSPTVTPATLATPISFHVPAIPSNLPFVTAISADGRCLVDQNGEPILVLADWAFSLTVDCSTTEMATYFAARQADGVNAVVVALVCGTTGGINNDGRTYDGITPFTATDLTMRSTYWARVDTMVALAAQYGITVFANPLNAQDWQAEMATAGTTNITAYGTALATRYAGASNIVWMLGIDYQSADWATIDPYLIALRNGLKTGSKLLTIQLNYFVSTSYDNSTWSADGIIDFVCSYSYYATYDANLDAYLTNPPGSRTAMPVFMSEANFTGENNWGGAATTDETLRRQFWWSLLCGAYATSYGHGEIWEFDNLWATSGALNDPALDQLHLGKTFLETLPFEELVPATSGIITTGQGTYHSGVAEDVLDNAWAASAQTADKLYTLCYFPTSRTIAISLSGIPTPVTAYWFDPYSGDTTSEGTPSAPTHPGTNDGGTQDWVLVVQGTDVTTATPSTLSTPIAFHAPTITSSPTVTPATLATPVSFHAPTIVSSPAVSPATLATPITFRSATVVSSPTVSPSALATPITFRSPSVAAGTIVSPSTLSTPIVFRTVTAVVSPVVSPSTVATPITFRAPTISGGTAPTVGTVGPTIAGRDPWPILGQDPGVIVGRDPRTIQGER